MDIYRSLDHRKILSDVLESTKEQGKKISFAGLAERIGLQKTYVSRVMSGEACWSSDQAFAVATELGFSPDESDYFSLLIEVERSGSEKRKKALNEKIKTLRRKNLRSQQALQAQPLSAQSALLSEYFADPYNSLVHVYLSIRKYQKQMSKLAKLLGLPLLYLLEIVARLQTLEVVRYDRAKDTVHLLKSSLHSPAGSPMVQAHQMIFRSISLDRLHRCAKERKNSFNAVFSGDVSLQETLWAEFLDYLKRVEEIAKNSKNPSEVFYLQFDLFPWTSAD